MGFDIAEQEKPPIPRAASPNNMPNVLNTMPKGNIEADFSGTTGSVVGSGVGAYTGVPA